MLQLGKQFKEPLEGERVERREIWQEPEHGQVTTETIRGTHTPSITIIRLIYAIVHRQLSFLFYSGNE